jgi:hypothetical protein
MIEKSRDHISIIQARKWLRTILVNRDSYEPLDWSQVIRVNYPPYKYIISHKFIHKNTQGIKERCAITIYLDNAGKVINFHKWEQHDV